MLCRGGAESIGHRSILACRRLSRNCRDLRRRRTGRSVRLYRDHGTIRSRAVGHENDRARPESHGGRNRHGVVHEVRPIVMAPHLSICRSGLPVLDAWWVDPVGGRGVLPYRRCDPGAFRVADGTISDEKIRRKRRTSQDAAIPGCSGDRGADRLRIGNDRDRWRCFSRASHFCDEMGHGASDGRNDSALQSDEFCGRPDRCLRLLGSDPRIAALVACGSRGWGHSWRVRRKPIPLGPLAARHPGRAAAGIGGQVAIVVLRP
ncbi:hypothetical protein SAMN04488021_13220 [Paracoccus aminovorans]|uniref:Uncharacterized protein n=1 Tax=Paracoccus aminovorans TaxID=34004 RepID=A0A1I3CNC6_9RHOB|nr:hypothetical protein JCM7685_0264 [Paracoccus aminovorans]SFH76025.1 hypothetical protein SAMN04488021_13220 [Paracoccus aminovorans]